MLRFPGLFLLLALIAGAIGFGGLAGNLTEFFKTMFFALIALAALGCIRNRIREPLDPGEDDEYASPDRLPGD